MTTVLIAIICYLLWTAAGLLFFFAILGEKYRKEKWYDRILMLPVMPIAYIIGWLNK